MTPRSRPVRPATAALAKLAGVLALAVCVAGCGIRTTSVPVDAGPAPSRMPCEDTGEDVSRTGQGLSVPVYLVCSSELVAVRRTARIPERKVSDSRVQLAQALLEQLQTPPPDDEKKAGFTTYVQGPLTVTAPRGGDPADTLRLSIQPEDMPTTALAQIVCTFAESDATDGEVVLAGPGDYPPRGYRCGEETKRRPDSAVPTLGPLPSPS